MRITFSQQLIKSITRILFALILAAVSLMPVSGVAHAQVHQSSCSEIWDTVITVSNNLGATRALRIGQGLSATAGRDDCDIPAPPMPPDTAFEAEIIGTPTYLFTDYRLANQAGSILWRVAYNAGEGGNPITFSWSPAALPGAGTWNLRYFDDSIPPDGDYVDVDMGAESSAQWTNIDEIPVRITYVTTRCTITANASGSWDSADTWNENCLGGIPSMTDDVYIPTGMAVAFNTATTVESLTIGNGGSLSFPNSNPLLVSDNAFVRGGTLNLGSLGSLTVNGALTNLGRMQQTKTINAGTAIAATVNFLDIGGYGGLTITSDTTSMGSTSVEISGGQLCDSDNTSIWRCFNITPAASVSTAGIVFYYAANELNTSACTSMQAWRSTGGQNWVSAGDLGTRSCGPEPYSVPYTNVTIESTGSFFALRSSENPTALTLQTFNANSVGSNFYILLAIGLVGVASLSGVVAWWASGKRKNASAGNG
jgi:hypothetical protein